MSKELIEFIEREMKWLKETYHTHPGLKPEFQRWYNDYAQEHYLTLESELKYYKKQLSSKQKSTQGVNNGK